MKNSFNPRKPAQSLPNGRKNLVRPRYSWPPTRKPRLSDWGIGMTLCIAATADYGQAIVVLSDTRVSLGYTSGESFNKASKVNQRWAVSIAGDNVTCASPVIEAAKERLWDIDRPSRKEVETVIVASVHEQLIKKIEAEVLSPYNFTVNEFTKSAHLDLGPEAFGDLRQQIAHVTLGVEFLVFGFDKRT